MVTDAQVRLLRQKIMAKKKQLAAAAAAGMSVRSARTWQRGALPSVPSFKFAVHPKGSVFCRGGWGAR